MLDYHSIELVSFGVCTEIPDGFPDGDSFVGARRVERVLAYVQLFVGGFDVCSRL